MVAPAVFGITNDGLNLAVKLLLLVLVAIWLALVFWTFADARRRIADPMLVTCAAVAAFFFPFVGPIVYAIVRPPEYLDDVRERELEIAAAEARLMQVQEHVCPSCGHEVEKTFLRCPNCASRLKEPCQSCGRPLDPRWRLCPYCEAEVAQPAAAPQQRRRARRPATAGAERAAAAREQAPRERARPSREEPRGARDEPRAAAPDPQTRVARGSQPGDGDAGADQPTVRRTRPPSADPA